MKNNPRGIANIKRNSYHSNGRSQPVFSDGCDETVFLDTLVLDGVDINACVGVEVEILVLSLLLSWCV